MTGFRKGELSGPHSSVSTHRKAHLNRVNTYNTYSKLKVKADFFKKLTISIVFRLCTLLINNTYLTSSFNLEVEATIIFVIF